MHRIAILFLFILFFKPVLAQNNIEVKNYLNQALDIMKAQSINKHKLDWEKIYNFAHEQAKGMDSIKQTYTVIDSTLKMLADQHSHFYPPEMVEGIFKGYLANGEQLPIVKTAIMEKSYAYLTVPHFYFANEGEWEQFITDAYHKIRELDKLVLKGWIIDLRDNDGGMLQPMIGMVAPFIHDEDAFGIKKPEGIISYYRYRNNAAYYGDSLVYQYKTPLIQLKNFDKPLVVLINKRTGSSGEFIAMAFKDRKNTQLIGQKTTGLTSSNSEFKLSDGAYLVLTNGTLTDRKGEPYDEVGKGISPDHVLEKEIVDQEECIHQAIRVLKQMSQ
ncbi:hypothetical protein DBR43_17470 [Pedobacter sp. KBW06]|nr:hypothetical protein DBR43_17470 [Pedobacter sp. KBW06]